MTRTVNVNIVYPTDPQTPVPGGTDTCIRDIIAHAPDDISIQMIGVTADPGRTPVGKWTACEINGRKVECFPVMRVDDLRKQQRVPLSLKFTIALLGKSETVGQSDILQYHRIEPMLAWPFDRRPTVLFVHTNMNVIKHAQSDIRWKYMPWLYERLETVCLRRVSQLYCVRTDAVAAYRRRHPDMADRIDFLPTWMAPETFYAYPEEAKARERKEVYEENRLPWKISDRVLIFVGRLDYAKNPLMLIEAFAIACKEASDLKLMMVGDGVLGDSIMEAIVRMKMQDAVVLLGVKTIGEVGRLMRCADMMVLSSAYEGMPRCIVEALGSGLPAVATKVGEIPRIIRNGENGVIVEKSEPRAFADGILSGLALCRSNGIAAKCLESVRQYTPQAVLAPVYDCYRRLAHSIRKAA